MTKRCGFTWSIKYIPVTTEPVLTCTLVKGHYGLHMAVDPDGRVVQYPYELRIDNTATT